MRHRLAIAPRLHGQILAVAPRLYRQILALAELERVELGRA